MIRQFSVRRVVGLFLIDWLGTLAMLYAAALLRAELGNLPTPLLGLIKRLEIPQGGSWVNWANARPGDILSPYVFVLVALIWPFFFIVFSLYDGRRQESPRIELLNVFLAICISTLTLSGVLYFTYRETPRVLILAFLFLDLALLLGSRVALLVFRRSWRGSRLARARSVLIIGAGPVGQRAAEQLREYAWDDIHLAGYVDDDPDKQQQHFSDLPVIGTLADVRDLVEAYQIADAVVALPLRAYEQLITMCRTLQSLGVQVHVVPDLFALSFPSATLEGFGGIPVVNLGRPGIFGLRRFFKRLFDVAVSTVALLLLSPLLALIAFLVKLDSPGPVLYRQQRIGENGKLFAMFKFRSMRADADPDLHKAYVQQLIRENTDLEQTSGQGKASLKMENDPRITRIGQVIRKISIDELPQLLNVMRGEMSLVGPRPPLPYELELYDEWHKRRLEVPPGITGWWQVKGRNRVSFDEMVRMDLYYIEHSSFWLDLKILVLTPRAVLSGQGAG